MLNGYGKKISENIKKKVMRLDQDTCAPKHPSIRTKITSFTRIRDLSKLAKNNTSCHELDLPREATPDPNRTAPLPYKSPLLSMLRKKPSLDHSTASMNTSLHKSENALHSVLRRLYPGSKKRLNLTVGETSLSELDLTLDAAAMNLSSTSVEVKLNDFEIIYQHLDSSFELLDCPTPVIRSVPEFEKFRNKKIATSRHSCSPPPPLGLEPLMLAMETGLIEATYESSLSSKSSINSEEGK
jgi:hypothetical protein